MNSAGEGRPSAG